MAKQKIVRQFIEVFIGLYCLAAILSGCTPSATLPAGTVEAALVSPGPDESVATVVPRSPTTASTLISSLPHPTAPPPTVTPSPSPTVTATPTVIASPTSTFTPAPTLTPLPTIPPQQRGQLYDELMSSNGGCMLPCWWGFELWVTTLGEVRQFYTAFNTYITEQSRADGISTLEALFVDPQIENGDQVVHTYIAKDDIVIEAQIPVMNRPEYEIESLLQLLGQPSEVRMLTRTDTVEGSLSTRLLAGFFIYFPEKGVFVSYFTGGVRDENAINFCFDEPGGATLRLWSPNIWDPNGDKSFDDRLEASREALIYPDYRPLKEVSNWDVEQIYTILSDPAHSECLETPSELWSP